MKKAILELAGWPENRLHETIAEGVPLIVDNATSLDESARRLFALEEYRASDVMRGFAEEEAAKVLVLLDAVRCPAERRRETLKCFHNHLAKRIYALACSFPSIHSFDEFQGFVAEERRPYYLDGPNSVDWIFPNSIISHREQAIYVDYVRDITEESPRHWWVAPLTLSEQFGGYRSPESVELCRAFCEAGAKSMEGLAVIADAWRGFVPETDTGREDLPERIANMLTTLEKRGFRATDGAANAILSNWSFPLWPFDLTKEPKAMTPKELREHRRLTIAWIEEMESRRDPPPAIDRTKVEAMSRAYANWQDECDRGDADLAKSAGSAIRVRTSDEWAKRHDLESYRRLRAMFEELDQEERAALLALAWYAQERPPADWPATYERARGSLASMSTTYQIGQGWNWLAGLRRWEEKPAPFSAGSLYRPDRSRS